MNNQGNDNKIGSARYSASNIEKVARVGMSLKKGGIGLGIGATILMIGYIAGSIFGFGGNTDEAPIIVEPTASSSTASVISEQTATKKNNFNTNNNYQPGEMINVADCDFSGMCVVLDAADDTDALYGELLGTQELLKSHGIDCIVTSYYDSAIDEIERIKSETGKTVFVASVQTNQNKTDQHLVATTYYNNDDALGKTTITEGDKNSADAFALSVESCMPFSVVKKGLADDYTDYDRRPSQLESDISTRGLEGVKAITIRTSEISPLSSGELGTILLNGIVKTSTLDNDQTYLVRPSSMAGYAVPGTIKDKYGYERVYSGGEFCTNAALLTREKPSQMTSQVGINYGNPIDIAYQGITSGAKTH